MSWRVIFFNTTQVIHYAEHVSDSATGKRIMRMFINLVKDLTEFRRKLVKLTNQRDERLEKIFATWKKTLEPTQVRGLCGD